MGAAKPTRLLVRRFVSDALVVPAPAPFAVLASQSRMLLPSASLAWWWWW